MLFGDTVQLTVRKPNLGNQDTSLSEDKNTKTLLEPCRVWKLFPAAVSSGVNISDVPGYHLLQSTRFHSELIKTN